MSRLQPIQTTKKGLIGYLIVLICSFLFLVIGAKLADDAVIYNDNVAYQPVKAVVTEIIEDDTLTYEDYNGILTTEGTVTFEAKIKSGPQSGEIVTAAQSFDAYMTIIPKIVAPNDKIVLYFSEGYTDQADYVWTEYLRSDALILFTVIFCLFLILFGKVKGLNTLISLAFTCLAIFYVFIPAVLGGHSPYLWSIIICIYTTFMTIFLVSGVNRKSMIAIFGCLGGVVFAGILALFMSKHLHLTGMTCEESMYLITAISEHRMDLVAIMFAGIIIGAVGAIMDVSMSIASALAEIQEQTGGLPAKQLFRSGITISRDIMGTMANTLILAYIGGCLPAALLYFAYYSTTPLDLFNLEMIVIEILQALIGSTGILIALPFTSLLGAALYKKRGATHPKTSSESLNEKA